MKRTGSGFVNQPITYTSDDIIKRSILQIILTSFGSSIESAGQTSLLRNCALRGRIDPDAGSTTGSRIFRRLTWGKNMSVFEQLTRNKGTVSSALGKELAQRVLRGETDILDEAIKLSSYDTANFKSRSVRSGAAKIVEIVA